MATCPSSAGFAGPFFAAYFARNRWAVHVKDDLDQLLDAEQRHAARLDEARAAAARLLESGRTDAESIAHRAAEDTQAACARAAAEVAAEVEAELQSIRARADERVRVYTTVEGERLRELSLFVLRTLLEDAS